jgi:hypothetical protein
MEEEEHEEEAAKMIEENDEMRLRSKMEITT